MSSSFISFAPCYFWDTFMKDKINVCSRCTRHNALIHHVYESGNKENICHVGKCPFEWLSIEDAGKILRFEHFKREKCFIISCSCIDQSECKGPGSETISHVIGQGLSPEIRRGKLWSLTMVSKMDEKTWDDITINYRNGSFIASFPHLST